MSSAAPTVSVIMAVYNAAPLVGETLRSLLSQSFADFEVVIVDDGSTDDTLSVLRAFDDPRIRVIEASVNQGPVCARNRALAAARGRYIAGLDHDDLCLANRLSRQVAYLDAHPDVVMVTGYADYLTDGVVSPGRMVGATTPGLIDWLLLHQNPLVWSTVMLRAQAAHALDPFTRPELVYAEDFDLYHRLRRFGRLARIDEPLLHYRRSSGSASQRHHDAMTLGAVRVLSQEYQPIFGDDAPARAQLMVRFAMGFDPVASTDVLNLLARSIEQLRAHFLATNNPDAQTLRLIGRETSLLWWRIVRRSVRSGSMPLVQALAIRPASVATAGRGTADLMVSGVIGHVRALLRRRAAA